MLITTGAIRVLIARIDLMRIGAARLHELPPGVARHNLLDIPAQGIKVHTVLLDETGKVFGRGQAYTIACLLQPSAQGDTGLDIAA